MAKINNTDERLVKIMASGEHALLVLDPDNLLGRSVVEGMSYNKSTTQWTVRIKNEKGYLFKIAGTGRNLDKIEKTEYLDKGETWTDVKTSSGSGNLSDAWGTLTSLPPGLKKRLSAKSMARDFTAIPPDLDKLAENAGNALFWNVETKKNNDVRKDFNMFKFKYEYDERTWDVYSVQFATISQRKGSTITLRTEADCFGLKNKKVTLDKDLGGEHLCSAACIVKADNIMKPSVRVAYDLANLLQDIYTVKGLPKEKKVIDKRKEDRVRKTDMITSVKKNNEPVNKQNDMNFSNPKRRQ